MHVCYDKLWKLLIDKHIRKTDLIKLAGISTNAMAKMGKSEPITMECLGKICNALDCTVDDILSFVYEEEGTH